MRIFVTFEVPGVVWDLNGRPVWDEVLQDGQKELKMEAFWATVGAL